MKADLSQLFKNGNNFKFKNIDFTSKKFKKIILGIKKEKFKIRESMKIDLNELRKINFII